METDFWPIVILSAGALIGLLSHAAYNKGPLQWALRFIMLLMVPRGTILVFFVQVRRVLSICLTGLDLIISGQIILPLIRKKLNMSDYFVQKTIFVPKSFPHLVALCIYLCAVFYLCHSIDWNSFRLPNTLLDYAQPGEKFWLLWPYNGIGLTLISFCGVGIFISRSFKECLIRLGLVRPSIFHIAIGIFLIFGSFAYDALWAIYTHHLEGQDLATQLSYYSPAIFTTAGIFTASVALALFSALVAGVGEEALIRGALQPVFGILPSALLQALFYAPFAHTPIALVKIAIWSTFMGLVRRYTNTTTTIIAHAGLNFITIILFALNP